MDWVLVWMLWTVTGQSFAIDIDGPYNSLDECVDAMIADTRYNNIGGVCTQLHGEDDDDLYMNVYMPVVLECDRSQKNGKVAIECRVDRGT